MRRERKKETLKKGKALEKVSEFFVEGNEWMRNAKAGLYRLKGEDEALVVEKKIRRQSKRHILKP